MNLHTGQKFRLPQRTGEITFRTDSSGIVKGDIIDLVFGRDQYRARVTKVDAQTITFDSRFPLYMRARFWVADHSLFVLLVLSAVLAFVLAHI